MRLAGAAASCVRAPRPEEPGPAAGVRWRCAGWGAASVCSGDRACWARRSREVLAERRSAEDGGGDEEVAMEFTVSPRRERGDYDGRQRDVRERDVFEWCGRRATSGAARQWTQVRSVASPDGAGAHVSSSSASCAAASAAACAADLCSCVPVFLCSCSQRRELGDGIHAPVRLRREHGLHDFFRPAPVADSTGRMGGIQRHHVVEPVAHLSLTLPRGTKDGEHRCGDGEYPPRPQVETSSPPRASTGEPSLSALVRARTRAT